METACGPKAAINAPIFLASGGKPLPLDRFDIFKLQSE